MSKIIKATTENGITVSLLYNGHLSAGNIYSDTNGSEYILLSWFTDHDGRYHLKVSLLSDFLKKITPIDLN